MTIDAQYVIRTINRAEDAHFILTGMARHQSSTPSDLGIDTSYNHGAPLDLTMHDLATEIHHILQDLAMDLADATGDWPDNLDTPGAALFIRQRAQHVVGHEGREDTLHTIEEHYRSATGILGMLPRRTKIPEYCECGHEQWVYHEAVAYTRCKGGHVSPLADHAYMDNAKNLTYQQAARLLGVSRNAIRSMIDRGILTGTPGSKGIPGKVDGQSVRKRRAQLAS